MGYRVHLWVLDVPSATVRLSGQCRYLVLCCLVIVWNINVDGLAMEEGKGLAGGRPVAIYSLSY